MPFCYFLHNWKYYQHSSRVSIADWFWTCRYLLLGWSMVKLFLSFVYNTCLWKGFIFNADVALLSKSLSNFLWEGTTYLTKIVPVKKKFKDLSDIMNLYWNVLANDKKEFFKDMLAFIKCTNYLASTNFFNRYICGKCGQTLCWIQLLHHLHLVSLVK